MSSLDAEVAKRLEEGDNYQAKARTGEEYDTMGPKRRKSSNKARLLDTWIVGATYSTSYCAIYLSCTQFER